MRNAPVAMIVMLVAGVASASPAEEPQRSSEPIIVGIPEKCSRFELHANLPEVMLWNQALSFAACLQDATVLHVTDPEELQPMMQALSGALAPSLVLYMGTIEYGPEPVQLRAAFQIGMMHVALIVRARSSLVAPADLLTNPAAARRYQELHDQLEPLLENARHTAWLVFSLIDRVASHNSALASDPVTKYMVRSARAMLSVIGDRSSSLE